MSGRDEDTGRKVEEVVEDTLAEVSPHEDGEGDTTEPVDRSGDTATDAGDSFTA